MQKTTPLAFYVVVADDDTEDHQLIKNAFHDCDKNHIITSVFNGEQLLDLLNQCGFYKLERERLPDLILLDLRMRIMGGLEALAQIKKSPNLKNIPVYMLSELDEKTNVQKALAMGAEAYFKKPLLYAELQKLVQQLCSNAIAKKAGQPSR